MNEIKHVEKRTEVELAAGQMLFVLEDILNKLSRVPSGQSIDVGKLPLVGIHIALHAANNAEIVRIVVV